MKKIKYIWMLASLFFVNGLFAQNEVDALRYSMSSLGGTARYSSMGGAYGAIGADFSTLSNNPAGIALYRKNEFTFTPSIFTGKTESTYNGNTVEDMKYNFNISNFGMVYSFKGSEKEGGWKGINFGFGLNRTSNFHNRISIEGDNHTTSMLDFYRVDAFGTSVDKLDVFSTRLAFDVGLIDTISGDNTRYYSAFDGGGMLQRKNIETRGAMQEMVFSLGGNYSDQLYVGGTVGIPYIRYIETASYSEVDKTDTVANIKSFVTNEDIETRGTGINFKFGLIYKPFDWVRLGAAVHTPTFFSMHDEWSNNIELVFNNGFKGSASSPQGSFDYELTTPMRAIGSIAFVLNGYGIISADYEFVDYSEARLRSHDYKYFEENDNIQKEFTAQHNIRIGAEAALGMVSLRGGVALYGSPYKSGINDASSTSYTGGIGIMDKGYFLDLGYVYNTSKEDYYLYDPALVNAAKNKKVTQSFLLTLGFKF